MPIRDKTPNASGRFSREDKRTNRTKSIERELRAAKALGARTTPNSGATGYVHATGDLRDDEIVWEQKSTDGPRISINARVIGKICREAAISGKHPGLHLVIEGMPEGLPTTWVAVPEDVWQMARSRGVPEE